ncbi:MAG: UDP-3-O-(3-hydroxymyristoyl)glucosamine N-acyltransferase [Candidatus Aureabacteria bacterium]|nr:UDP-3-O-(3-hydroxymyristoyl)glucosamine N-acyltransferase [Candidatus Auribacterota bacterium]
MKKTLQEISQLLQGRIIGDEKVVISGVSGIKEAQAGDITFLANARYACLVSESRASAVIIDKEFSTKNIRGKSFIVVENPSLSFARLVELVAPVQVKFDPGISEKSHLGEGVKTGTDVHIAPFAVLDKNSFIGDRTVIGAGSYIGQETKIGKDCLIYPNVSIRERVVIGDRVIIHSGAVVGSDGFGFSTVKGVHKKIPQIGTVIIEDDVEIGANVTIDRARFGKTIIHKGTKIDNLVQIAHNVEIGDNTIIVAQTGIAGSTVIGKNVILAGQSGVNGHISISDNAVIAARAGVIRDVKQGEVVSGYPALSHNKTKRIQIAMTRLPEMLKKLSELEKKINELEKKADEA